MHLSPVQPDSSPLVLQYEPGLHPDGPWLLFSRPCEILRAEQPDQVQPAIRRLEEAVGSGLWAAGWMAYEAAPGLDAACVTHPPDGSLLWFGLFEQPQGLPAPPSHLPGACTTGPPLNAGPYRVSPWRMDLNRKAYREQLSTIKDRLAAGETYQVNFTTPLTSRFQGSPYAFFLDLLNSQRRAHAVYLQDGCRAVLSISPERFFVLDGEHILCRPMKGTRARGCTNHEDRLLMQGLQTADKDRAENLMIVDMIRNDLGRVARPGSVQVESLFDIERHETILQMTSTITAETAAGPLDLFTALFPCASITGAPKIHTMNIIAELETHARGLYTGCIGCWAPDRRARFNVAIRSVETRLSDGWTRYGTGSGIVWDSDADTEFAELSTKTRVLEQAPPPFHLLETMLLEDGRIHLLEPHLKRMADSAEYFDYCFDHDRVLKTLQSFTRGQGAGRWRIRLLLDRDGRPSLEAVRQADVPGPPLRAALAVRPVQSADPFLYHKTTHRVVYREALSSRPGMDEVILFNERGELTECSIGNLVLEKKGRRFTPPVSSGLLAGTLREVLLQAGDLEEAVLRPEDLFQAQAVYMINSVQGQVPLLLSEEETPP